MVSALQSEKLARTPESVLLKKGHGHRSKSQGREMRESQCGRGSSHLDEKVEGQSDSMEQKD